MDGTDNLDFSAYALLKQTIFFCSSEQSAFQRLGRHRFLERFLGKDGIDEGVGARQISLPQESQVTRAFPLADMRRRGWCCQPTATTK